MYKLTSKDHFDYILEGYLMWKNIDYNDRNKVVLIISKNQKQYVNFIFFGEENVFHLIILHKILEGNFFSILNYQFLYFYIIHAI